MLINWRGKKKRKSEIITFHCNDFFLNWCFPTTPEFLPGEFHEVRSLASRVTFTTSFPPGKKAETVLNISLYISLEWMDEWLNDESWLIFLLDIRPHIFFWNLAFLFLFYLQSENGVMSSHCRGVPDGIMKMHSISSRSTVIRTVQVNKLWSVGKENEINPVTEHIVQVRVFFHGRALLRK